MRALALVVVAMLVTLLPSQQLVADINPFTDDPGSAPGPFVTFGSGVVFAASTAATGRELWFLANTSTQAQLIADLAPGPADASPEHVVWAGGSIFFFADDGTGQGLYVSDATFPGTRRLRSLRAAPPSRGIQIFAIGSLVLAIADDGVRGPELWRSDGTVVGTQLVVELEPGPGGGRLITATTLGNELYFALRTPHTGEVRTLLVRSDGTAAGTVVITRSDQGGPLVAGTMQATTGQVLFAGSPVGIPNFELWRTDGTAAGTSMVVDLDPNAGSFVGPMIAFAGRVAFVARAGAYGDEPVISDGTATGTQIVDVNVLVGRGSAPAELTAFGGDLCLFAIAPEGTGLFRIDGNQLTTTFLRTLHWQSGARPSMVAAGTTLYLRAIDPPARSRTAAQLWASDGTVGGTRVLGDLRYGLRDPQFDYLLPLGTGVIFTIDDGLVGSEPWRSDGTTSGTRVAANVHANATTQGIGSQPTFFLHAAHQSVFDADDGDRGREPWVTDGSSSGTRRVADLVPGADGSRLAPVGSTAAGAVFAATPGPSGALLTDYWVSDGGASVPRRLAFPSFLGPPLPGTVAADGDRAVVFGVAWLLPFGAGLQGHYLLRTDGQILQAIVSTPSFDAPRAVTMVNGVPFFAAPWGGNGYELWTPRGLVLDLRPGGAGSDPGASLGVAFRRAYVFSADDGISGIELWRSDGTANGTRRLADLAPGMSSSTPRHGAVAGDALYFVADVTGAGAELCVTDGTAGGTRLVADLRPGPLGSDPSDLVMQQGGVYFAADDGVAGRELWFSDGAAVTRRVADLVPGAPGSDPRALAALGSRRVLLVATDAGEGDEPWISDGSAAGTQRLPIRPGTRGSGVAHFDVRPDGRVLFVADDGSGGLEPWIFDPGAVAVPLGATCGVGATRLGADDPILGSTTTLVGTHDVLANLAGVLFLSTPMSGQVSGCRTYVDPSQIAVPLTLTNATFRLPVRVPNVARFNGVVLHAQAVVGLFAAPPGWSTSNAVALRLGR